MSDSAHSPVATSWLQSALHDAGASLVEPKHHENRSSFMPLGEATNTVKRLFTVWKLLEQDIARIEARLVAKRVPNEPLIINHDDEDALALCMGKLKQQLVESVLRIEMRLDHLKHASVFSGTPSIESHFQGWSVGYDLVYDGPQHTEA